MRRALVSGAGAAPERERVVCAKGRVAPTPPTPTPVPQITLLHQLLIAILLLSSMLMIQANQTQFNTS